MPHPYELHVRPPRSLLKHFFIVLPAFLSIVLYNTLNLVNELERHRSVQVRTSISDILEASTKLSGEVIACPSTLFSSSRTAKTQLYRAGMYHECSPAPDGVVKQLSSSREGSSLADKCAVDCLITSATGVENLQWGPSPSSSATLSTKASPTVTAPLLTPSSQRFRAYGAL